MTKEIEVGKLKITIPWLEEGCGIKDIVRVIATWIPLISIIISIVTTIVAFVAFIISGGFTEQIKIIQDSGNIWEGSQEALTTGTVSFLREGIMPKVIGVLTLVCTILLIIRIIIDTNMVLRILMIIDVVFTLGVASVPIYALIMVNNVKNSIVTDEQESFNEAYLKLRFLFDDPEKLKLYVILVFAAVIAFVIIALIDSDTRGQVLKMIIAALVHFAACPLALLFLENVVPLFILAIIIGVIIVGFYIFLSAIATRDREVTVTMTDKETGEVIHQHDQTISRY